MTKITIGTDENSKPFTMPVDLVTQTTAIVGMRGSGKTNTGVVMAEGMLEAGQQVIIIDPLDVWWGLRSSANGKADGFPVVVLGGEHQDLPLEPGGGRILADFVTENSASVVLSTRHLSKGKQRQLVADFCEQLYDRKGKGQYKTPVHVFIDEADAFAPQRIEGDTARCFGAIDDLVRRGRSSGFGVTCITQRPAVLHKDILTQAEVLTVHRIVSPQDRKAIEAWVEVHDAEGRAAQVLATLHTLERGDAWVWSPGWLGLLQRVAVRKRNTFDSSYTPKIGESASTPKKVADVPLDALKSAMAATIEKAKADDPVTLRKEIASLKKELAAKPAAPVAPPAKETRVEVPIITAKQEATIEHATDAVAALAGKVEALHAKLGEIAAHTLSIKNAAKSPMALAKRVATIPNRNMTPRPAPKMQAGDGERMGKAERAILTALAQHGISNKSRVAKLAGYAGNGGGFNNSLGALRSRGFITTGDPIEITYDGLGALGSWETLPTGRALFDHWMNQLGRCEQEILRVLYEANGEAITKEEIAAQTNSGAGEPYNPAGGGFNNSIGHLRTLALIDGKGQIRAAEELYL